MRLHQHAPQIRVAFARSARLSFSRAFVVAGAKRRPVGQMFGVRARCHIRTDFGDYGPCRDTVHAGNRAQPIHQFGMRKHVLSKPCADIGHFGVQTVQFVEKFAEQIAEVQVVSAFQGQYQLRLLRLETVMGKFGKLFGMSAPASYGAQNPSTAQAHDVAEHAGQLDIDGLQQTADTVDDPIAVLLQMYAAELETSGFTNCGRGDLPSRRPSCRNSAIRPQSMRSVLRPASART